MSKGPTIHLDEGHNSRHTYGGLGGFVVFKNVLTEDGYHLIPFSNQFDAASLQHVKLLSRFSKTRIQD